MNELILQQLVQRVEQLLLRPKNLPIWRGRYQRYLRKLQHAQMCLQQHENSITTKAPLRLYTSVSAAGNWKPNDISLDARLYGTSVATLRLKGGTQEWMLHKNFEERIRRAIGSEVAEAQQALRHLCSLVQPGCPFSPAAEAALDALLSHLPHPAAYARMTGSKEAALESAVLQNFALSDAAGKWLPHIQPIGLSAGKNHGIIPLQFPAPFNANVLYKSTYSLDELTFRAQGVSKSGAMDILARTGAGRHPGTKLAVLELKKSADNVLGAMRQALAYAVFLRTLLRCAPKDEANKWWRLMGYGDERIPAKLALQAVAVLPMPDKGTPRTENLVHTLPVDQDTITTHYLYLDTLHNRSITSLPRRGAG